jgi:formylmethanofuran dehydrogenase subunit E
VGGRTLRILDFGKVAATFVDIHTEETIRLIPRSEARSLAEEYVADARNRWEAMLFAYQVMPGSELFTTQTVSLDMPISKLISRAGVKATCELCQEEIINGREIVHGERILCMGCAGNGYYHSTNKN